MRPEVTVVIPIFNSAEWLEPTLLSVLRQTASPERLEIVIADNASTDGGARLAEAILKTGRSHFKIRSLESNAGPSRARNVGWISAKAPWIQFLDSDDLLAPDKLEHQLHAAADAPEAAAVIYSEWQNYVLDGDWKPAPPVIDPILEPDIIRNLLEAEHFVHTGCQLIRKSWLERVHGFDEKCWLIEDVDLSLRFAMEGGKFLRAPAGRGLFYYRKRGSASLSGSRIADFLNGCVRNYRLAEDHWRVHGLLSDDRLRFLIAGYETILHNLIEADPKSFDSLHDHVLSLQPGWKPAYDSRIRLLSSVVGYRRAAQLALQYRRWKVKLPKTAPEE